MQKFAPWSAVLPIFFLASIGWAQTNGAGTLEADTILANGKIITVDATDSVAEAVAIRNGKILEVGAKPSVMKHAGQRTQIIDLHGRTATPGLIDAHLHFAEVGPIYSINLSAVRSIPQVLEAVRERVAKAKAGEWIQGEGWDEGKLAERRYIYAADLDRVAPRNPVWLEHTTGHYGVANSVALLIPRIRRPERSTVIRKGKPRAC
jgi:hypothetical protein